MDLSSIIVYLHIFHFIYMCSWFLQTKLPISYGTPPSSLIDSTASPKVKTTEGQGVGVRFLVRSISGVKGRARALGWGLGRMTSRSIIHTDLHKTNKLVSA